MDLEDKKVVAIGGAGLIGSHLVDLLVLEEISEIVVFDNFYRGSMENLQSAVKDSRVKVIEGDIKNLKELKKILKGKDFVFHFAASWLLECIENPGEAVENNIMGTYNLIEACIDAKIKKVIFSSSASVYGNAVEVPMTESHPYNNRTLYGATKIAGEHLFRAFYEMYGLNYVGLRYMNVYGPRQDYKGAYVVVIMKILDRIDNGLPPIIYGDGSQCYDFVFVNDVARANILALKADVTDDFFNIGTGQGTTIKELTGLLLDLTDSTLKPQYEPQGQTFVTNRIGSTAKAADLLGFRAKTELKDGLKKLIEWRKGHKKRNDQL
ncbi:MAG: NAD-dependent epimerase/dehydratase family protein [Thermodesulfobacteriota bacterium]|nr:NAD-dependent epimerase/dehydratase family protein [Thermodesulfobacteriota bacterium]